MKYRNKLFLSLLCSAVSFSVTAQDKTGFYLGGKLGMSVQHQTGGKFDSSYLNSSDNKSYPYYEGNFSNSNKGVFSGGLVGGYNFKDQFDIPLRLELEYVLRGNAGKTIYDSDSDTYMGSLDWVENYTYKTKVRTQTVMLHGYWDIQTGSSFTPYLTAGLGIAHNRLQNSGVIDNIDYTDSSGTNFTKTTEGWSTSGSKTRFAWAIGTGVAYEINQDWVVDLGYRYIDAGKATVRSTWIDSDNDVATGKSSVKVKYHDIHLGFRYAF